MIAWSMGAGLLARIIISAPRPSVPSSLVCGLIGWLAGLAADRLLGFHAVHPFRADGLLPATGVALGLLAMARRRSMRRHGRDRTIFFRS